MIVTDFHVHAFPDKLAADAISHLSETGGEIKPFTDGTINGLIHSMDAASIDRAVVCAVATRPDQFSTILKWCRSQASERIIPFPAVHPDAEAPADQVRQIAASGFKGFKLHPYYQEFVGDEDKLMVVYAEA